MKAIATILLVGLTVVASGQPNCNMYKMNGNDSCYNACQIATEPDAGQGSRQSQMNFDRAIELCPDFDYAYFEKAVPYLKRGDFVSWKKLIDKAVEISPTQHLGYRGWCRYQFVRDYRGAIRDFELLDSLVERDIGYSQNGDYHLNVAKALCYRAIGENKKAIEIMESQLSTAGYSTMNYDYLHLGIMKMEAGDTAGAVEYFQKSITLNDYLADPYYFLGLIDKSAGRLSEAKGNFEKAKGYYIKCYKRFDPYTHPIDKVYLADIERELVPGN